MGEHQDACCRPQTRVRHNAGQSQGAWGRPVNRSSVQAGQVCASAQFDGTHSRDCSCHAGCSHGRKQGQQESCAEGPRARAQGSSSWASSGSRCQQRRPRNRHAARVLRNHLCGFSGIAMSTQHTKWWEPGASGQASSGCVKGKQSSRKERRQAPQTTCKRAAPAPLGLWARISQRCPPSSGKQCCVRALVRSSVPHGAGGVGTAKRTGRTASTVAAAAAHTAATGRAIARSLEAWMGLLVPATSERASLGGGAELQAG